MMTCCKLRSVPRSTMPWRLFILGICVLSLGLGAYAEGKAAEKKDKGDKKGKESQENTPVFFPPPPEQPRIQFLRALNGPKDIKPKVSGFKKFLVGEGEEKDDTIGKAYGLAFKSGQLFVCDTGRNYVAELDLKKKSFTAIGRDYPGQLKKPVGVAVDTDGTTYVADTGLKCIMVYSPEGHYARAIGLAAKLAAADVAVYEDKLYVCESEQGQIIIFDKITGEERKRLGTKGSDKGQLFLPSSLTLDPDGNVFVSDTGNSRVMKFNSHGEFVQQFGQVGTGLGQFVRPKGVAVDHSGRMYAVDVAFENVQIFDREGKLLLFFGQTGNAPGGVNLPARVCIDYDSVDLFKDAVAPGYSVEYLIFVSSQYGANKVNVYGFLKGQ